MSLDKSAGHASHGNTPAAWTAVTIMIIAFGLGSYAVVELNWTLFWISVGLLVVGAIVGKVLQMMGFGAPAEEHQPDLAERGLDTP